MIVVDVLWDWPAPEDPERVRLVTELGTQLLTATRNDSRELSIVLTDDATITELNTRWRQQPRATDVLSFSMDEGEPVPETIPGPQPLGDIVISMETAATQAVSHGHALEVEITILVVHAFCHLLGHDHGAEDEAARMRAEEQRLLAIVAPEL